MVDAKRAGTMRGTVLGSLTMARVSGSPGTVRRTPSAAATRRTDHLKLCVQLTGSTTIGQSGHHVRVGRGRMGLYDTGLPYLLRLEDQWSCIVLTFPHRALSLPHNVVRQAMLHPHPAEEGPGAVLADFVTAAMNHQASIGTSAGRLGEAGLHLIAAALRTMPPDSDAAAADTQRQDILRYAREHLSSPDLSHDHIAAVHLMAPRSLHRLFENEPYTVTEYIRLRRLESAHRDLTDPLLRRLSIARIAGRWCFSSQAHFTRAFQAKYGVVPSAVRALDNRLNIGRTIN